MRLFHKKITYASCGVGSQVYNPRVISNPKRITLGNNVTVLDRARLSIYGGDKDEISISIGDNCYIGFDFSILAKDPVIIQKDVLIASNVIITSENHGIDPESDLPYMSQELTGKGVCIGEGSWIGEKVCILPGVTIGKKCVIGAGSVVTKDIPDYCIAGGNPAKVIKKYDFDEHKWIRV